MLQGNAIELQLPSLSSSQESLLGLSCREIRKVKSQFKLLLFVVSIELEAPSVSVVLICVDMASIVLICAPSDNCYENAINCPLS